jgi:hypothetical protein
MYQPTPIMLFLERLLDDLLRCWAPVFAQNRTGARAVKLGIGLLLGMGKRTITRSLCFHGEDQRDWSADDKFFSRSKWDEQALFKEIVPQLVRSGHLKTELIAVAWDDTAVPRSGKCIAGAQWMRDAMGPAFHVNLIWGQRFLQGSVLTPLYEQDQTSSPRAIPVSFREVAAVKKPGKGASAEKLASYQEARKKHNLSVAAVEQFTRMREDFDARGMESTILLHTVDGSYLNRTTLAYEFERALLVGRVRKNARLCFPAPEGGRKVYADYKFTPESVGKDKRRKWKTARIFHGGEYRDVRYKEVKKVLWQGGGRRRPLRLIVVAPIPYRTTENGRTYYRQKAYLLCTDHEIAVDVILQKYFDRWQIEYNHRDEKDILGVGQAQVWAELSTPRVPAFKVTLYSQMHVSALVHFGPQRTADYLPLPCWRKTQPRRASCQDMVNLLRHEVLLDPTLIPSRLGTLPNHKTMALSAAA